VNPEISQNPFANPSVGYFSHLKFFNILISSTRNCAVICFSLCYLRGYSIDAGHAIDTQISCRRCRLFAAIAGGSKKYISLYGKKNQWLLVYESGDWAEWEPLGNISVHTRRGLP
jgi:hypothetical protein